MQLTHFDRLRSRCALMKLQTKPTRWTCMATSFAMALDIDVHRLLEALGHDGSESVAPYLTDPIRRRGHHVQECIEFCLTHGFAVTPVELFPRSQHGVANWHVIFGDEAGNWRRFLRHLETSRGVIIGQGHDCGHAVAYEHGRIYDPDGREYDYSREACEARGFFTQCLWRMDLL